MYYTSTKTAPKIEKYVLVELAFNFENRRISSRDIENRKKIVHSKKFLE